MTLKLLPANQAYSIAIYIHTSELGFLISHSSGSLTIHTLFFLKFSSNYHITMASKLEVDVEVKCNADQYWEIIKDSNKILPEVFPDQYKSIKVLEGDGKSVGSVRRITYGEGKVFFSIYFCC